MTESEPLLGDVGGTDATNRRRHLKLALYQWAFIVPLVVALVLAGLLITQNNEHTVPIPPVDVRGKKNVIMMVTDGMGPALLSLARSFRQHRDNLPLNDTLVLDRYLVGLLRTRLLLLLVTDLAAGATAFLCALKLYNGAIGVLPDGKPCGTVLEALKLQGYLTGLVVTTRVTDATPGAFLAHVDYRWQEDQIAEQQLNQPGLGRMVDLIIGGGRCFYTPKGKGGCRSDERDLVAEAQKQGWTYFSDVKGYEEIANNKLVPLPLLGLVAEGDIPFDIDRDPKLHPLLEQQAQLALRALSDATKDLEQGFFLLIEGLRIDHAGHQNDPAAQVREVLAYDEAFQAVIDFVDQLDVETVVILTLDHETGGLVTARQISAEYPNYAWYPQVLIDAQKLGEYVAQVLLNLFGTLELPLEAAGKEKLRKQVQRHLGVDDLTNGEVKLIEQALNLPQLVYVLNNIVSVRLETGWTTHGHLAVDVNIYAHTNLPSLNHALNALRGNHENIEIGAFMEAVTGSDLAAITEQVKHADHKPRRRRGAAVDAFHQAIAGPN